MTAGGRYDVCVVGAGLVGLSVAKAVLERYEGASVLILEKEGGVARHQSEHNSGVVHSGLYYKPGSLKAALCVEGRREVEAICDAAGIPILTPGKLVVATGANQIPALDELERRGKANGLAGLKRLNATAMRDVEPNVVGVEALHVPETAVVDFSRVAEHIARGISLSGARIEKDSPVTQIRHGIEGVEVHCGENRHIARILVNCAGLHSDQVAALAGLEPSMRIIPFRGEYYRMSETSSDLVRGLVYPVPDPRFPFLGVHFTRKMDGTVEVGPNAVLALGREHYRGTSWRWGEARSIVLDPATRRLARRYWRSGLSELVGSRSRMLYAKRARRLVPAMTSADLVPGGSGVRAQAVTWNGELVDDFVIEVLGSTIHVLNAPSPGATASVAIGRHLVRSTVASLW